MHNLNVSYVTTHSVFIYKNVHGILENCFMQHI